VDLLQIIFFPGYGTVVCLDVHEEKYRSESNWAGRFASGWWTGSRLMMDQPYARAQGNRFVRVDPAAALHRRARTGACVYFPNCII
jgi:hypothetical protein